MTRSADVHKTDRKGVARQSPRSPSARWVGLLVVVITTLVDVRQPALAQFGPFVPTSRFELADSVQLDRADSTVLAHFERIKAFLADRQWDEALAALGRVMEDSGDKLIGVTEHRFIRVREYAHLQLATLPEEALTLYRSRVDPLARRWYEEGVKNRDAAPLRSVLQEAFASSYGDDALMALGEMSLESGDYTSARWHWERIIPAKPPAGAPRTWPGYPDTNLDLAAVRARLVLVSILEGSTDRARDELAQFAKLHKKARGRFGGLEVNYAEALESLLTGSTAWPTPKPSADWPTFAGSPARNRTAPKLIDVGPVAWRIRLQDKDAAKKRRPLNTAPAFHPVHVGRMILVNDLSRIFGVDATGGKPIWPDSDRVLYRPQFEGIAGSVETPSRTLGLAECTMTVSDGKVYARMGSPVTGWPAEPLQTVRPGSLVCLDLNAQAWLQWRILPEKGWAFEGSPVVRGENVYVAMRRSEIRPQSYVACFDAQTGRRRWRRFVCGAETPARGMMFQITSNLLTLSGETLYLNTNLGAVAALSAHDGTLRWVSLYPRALTGDMTKLEPHWQRQLNPCMVDHGTLLVAPADSPRVFAFDASTGQMLWQSDARASDVQYLLGTTEDHLIAGGGKLYWIALRGENRGRVEHVWPNGAEKPGYGRGLVTADKVLWPTRERIHVFDPHTARPTGTIDLVPRGATGGNLMIADGRLLIATDNELIALKREAGVPNGEPNEVAAR